MISFDSRIWHPSHLFAAQMRFSKFSVGFVISCPFVILYPYATFSCPYVTFSPLKIHYCPHVTLAISAVIKLWSSKKVYLYDQMGM